jgi:hypothetical protein
MAQFTSTHGNITWDQAIDQYQTDVQQIVAGVWTG